MPSATWLPAAHTPPHGIYNPPDSPTYVPKMLKKLIQVRTAGQILAMRSNHPHCFLSIPVDGMTEFRTPIPHMVYIRPS